jgi:SAM-dependent methyltransferase
MLTIPEETKVLVKRVGKRIFKPFPPVGMLGFGSFRRLTPISKQFGFDRGQPIDRYYIENFLAAHSNDVRGRVLEVMDNSYTLRYGGDKVTQSDVLDIVATNPAATIIADLNDAEHIPTNSFDCIIFTQVLHLIYDVRSVLKTLYRILSPGGTLLMTVPGITPIKNEKHFDGGNWRWSFTSVSIRDLWQETCSEGQLEVAAYGNVLVAVSFLQGLAMEELRKKELDYKDPNYEVLITVKISKPGDV